MTSAIVLIVLVGGAVAVAARYAYLYAKAKKELEEAGRFQEAQHKLVNALRKAFEHQEELRKTLDKVDEAKTADDLNKLYYEILAGVQRSDGVR